MATQSFRPQDPLGRFPRAYRAISCASPARRNSRLRVPQGFTLLELLIASLVVSIGMISLLSLILFAMKMRFDSELSSTALKLSQQIIEGLKSRASDDPLLLGPGNVLMADGTIDFDSPQDPLATSIQLIELNKSLHTSWGFETRWNITSVAGRKILTVATRRTGSANPGFSPVNLKIILPSE